jgi:hypothetical protein
MYQIDPDGTGAIAPYAVYCDMTTNGGGWTQILKADGRATTFVYNSAYWTNTTLLNAGSTDNSFTESKVNAFTNVRFNQLLAGMTGNGYDRSLLLGLSTTYASAMAMFSGGQVTTGAGRTAWLNLIPNSTLQPNCNAEGINVNPAPSYNERVRVGILGNNENDCASPDSRFGIGGYGDNCSTLLNQSVGNTTRCGGTNGDADVTTYGYLRVRDSAATVNTWFGGGLATSCTVGVGACARTGTFTCRADGNGTQCSATAGSATTETCNGIDDDCNGVVDDIAPTSCTLGACAAAQLRCPLTTAGTTVAAVCVRTGYVAAGTVCRAAVAGGCDVQEVCTGTTDACPADVVASAGTVCRTSAGVCDVQEVCNGSSNACPANGFVAAGTVCRNSVNVPACDPPETCTGSAAACPADVVTRTPTPETCNGVDDNCNGTRDESVTQTCYTGPGGTLGVGVCRAGTQTCVVNGTGTWGACTGQTLPATEVCDNLDNDCNGTTDNGLTRTCYNGPTGTSGVGICRSGTQTCVAGSWGSTCPGEVVPRTETCNATDDDCDGTTDDPYRTTSAYGGANEVNNAACGSGCATTNPVTGACSCPAGYTARAFSAINDCSGALPQATINLCHAGTRDADDNWGGTYQLDDAVGGSLGCRSANLYTGACSCPAGTTGVSTRVIAIGSTGARLGSNIVWCVRSGSLPRSFGGVYELDDAVSGGVGCRVANPYTSGCSCGAGFTAQPYRVIVDASTGLIGSRIFVCTRAPAGALGAACTVGVGACARTATNVCTTDGSATVCNTTPGTPTAETCNNVDDNCNGSIDESLTRACYTGSAATRGRGICRDGTETCAAGAWSACAGQVLPTTETCNSLDDNCNGTVDDNSSTACGSAINLGSIPNNGSVTRTDWIAGPAGSEQWYVVDFPIYVDFAQHGTGTPQIELTAGPSVRFDVYSACGGSPLGCGSGGTAAGRTTWSFSDTASLNGAGAYTTRNVTWPARVYIRVYRVSAPTTCATQTLRITRPSGSEYQAAFTVGVTPNSTVACTAWNNFRLNINPARTYTSITMRGTNSPTGRTCTGAAANTLCQALRTGNTSGTVSVSCGGVVWSVGQCYSGQVELNADGTFCSCASSWAVRPCHLDPNFGGVNTGSCGAANQTMIVNCQ